jgi:hypothetical protein
MGIAKGLSATSKPGGSSGYNVPHNLIRFKYSAL